MSERQSRYQGGFCGWRGWISVFNPLEVIRGVAFSFEMASLQKKGYQSATNSDTEYVSLAEPYNRYKGSNRGTS